MLELLKGYVMNNGWKFKRIYNERLKNKVKRKIIIHRENFLLFLKVFSLPFFYSGKMLLIQNEEKFSWLVEDEGLKSKIGQLQHSSA